MEEENWDPEPEEQDPATITDEPIIDIEGDDDSNDLGLLGPNAPDEILDDDRSINEAPPDTYGDAIKVRQQMPKQEQFAS